LIAKWSTFQPLLSTSLQQSGHLDITCMVTLSCNMKSCTFQYEKLSFPLCLSCMHANKHENKKKIINSNKHQKKKKKKKKEKEEEEASKGTNTLMSFIYLSDMVSFV